MIRTQISVDAGLYQRAKKAASNQGISLAELCRRGLEQAVGHDNPTKPWMALAGSLEGRSGDSVSIDQDLYNQEHP